MKKRLLLMVLATTMTLSMLVGCGKEDTKDKDTTPATNVEQNSNSNVDDTTKEDAISKDDSSKEEETNYNEKFEDVETWIELWDEEQEEIRYAAAKFVYEDMTQNFKHKKEFKTNKGIHIWESEKTKYGQIESLVCDINNIIPEDSGRFVWDRDTYKEFSGFDKESVKAYFSYDFIVVELYAYTIEYQGEYKSPLCVSVAVTQNDDGTFSYNSATITYDLYDYLLE